MLRTEADMNCPECASKSTQALKQATLLGYRCFRCSDCGKRFNERTGTPFNFLEYPTDIVLLVVLWRLRYKLSVRDLAEMLLGRQDLVKPTPVKPTPAKNRAGQTAPGARRAGESPAPPSR